jgi:tetratricopeptide (TPR) repeat protein
MVDMIGRRYRLDATLGEGGMGEVYRALDRLTGEYVALKRVNTRPEKLLFGATNRLTAPNSSTDLRLSLAQEFKMLASLRHPHIISVLDYGFETFVGDAGTETHPYFTMELLANARTIVDAARGQPLDVQIDLLAQLLRALTYLHRRGIIHRDIKPTNVMVIEQHGDLIVKTLDFGLSVGRGDIVDDSSTAGTLAYMSPELLMGTPASELSDLYAVGVIAYEMLTGRHPFNTHEVGSLLNQVFEVTPDMSLIENIGVANTVVRLMEKQPYDRFIDANEAIAALSEATHHSITQETAAVRESFLQAARLVGRDEELAELTRALDEAVVNSHGSAWLIGGESGVGKSRLIEELRARAQVRGALVIRGQSVSTGGTLYGLWRPVVRWLALLAELSDEEAGSLIPLVPDIEMLLEREVPEPPDLPPAQIKARLFQTIENLFRRQMQPIVLLLEDLHWSQESLDILTHLNGIVGDIPLLIVGNYRDDERPGLSAQLPDMKHMKLQRLTAGGIAELSAEMLGEPGRAQTVVDLLQRETEGNVFFLIEVVRALAEDAGQLDRIGTTTLPSAVFSGGIQRIVARRLELVPRNAQALLRKAAVMGRQLDLNVLKALLKGGAGGKDDLPLQHHPQMDLAEWLAICSDAAVIEVYEERWRFTHDKLREGVLALADKLELPQLHREVALAIERIYSDAPEQTVTLAYHWEMAGDVQKILHYTTAAGERALRNGANRTAKAFIYRALTALNTLEGTNEAYQRFMIDLVMKFSKGSMDQPSDDVLPRLQEALAAAESLQDEGLQARVLNSTGAYYFILGQSDNSIRCLSRSIPLAEKLGLEELLPLSYNIVGQSLYVQGNLPRATRMLYKCIALAGKYHEADLESSALAAYASVLSKQGRHAESLAFAERAIITGEKVHLRRLEVNLMTMGFGAAFGGQHDAAIDYLERSLQSAEKTQALYTLYLAPCSLGNVYIERGEYAKARAYLQRGLQAADKARLVVFLPYMRLAYYSYLEMAEGNWDKALAGAEDALKLAQETSQRSAEAEILCAMGIIFRQQGIWDEAELLFTQSTILHRDCNTYPRAAIATLELARYYQLREMKEEARAACEEALAEFERMDMKWHIEKARKLLTVSG